jgi:peptidoglycan/xylan/chitin deacetylase (PgdA/CDA1 family)
MLQKRELLARAVTRSGGSWLASRAGAKDSLLVLNYHRIGNPAEAMFDPGVFSASAEQFYEQMVLVKKQLSPVTLDEALDFIDGREKTTSPRCRVLITFDDAYLDIHDVAFPILRSLGLQGVFFVVSGYAGSSTIPWWDCIAYLLRTARRRVFALHYPSEVQVNMDREGFGDSLRAILGLYKQPGNVDGERFTRELAESCGGDRPPAGARVFCNWDELRVMLSGGMAIGSHTHSHTVLSQLQAEQQREELTRSRQFLMREFGCAIDVVAYPVGSRTAFTPETEEIARAAGYRAAFSGYGGINLPGRISRYNLARESVVPQSWDRFRARVAICRRTGCFWP